MIIFADNIISVVDDIESADSSVPEDLLSEDSSVPVDPAAEDSSFPEDPVAEVSSVPDDLESKDSSVSEDLESKDTSFLDEISATGETQQSSTPTIINDIVVPDNSYSKYCFFFIMLLFALFVGRSFRKGV